MRLFTNLLLCCSICILYSCSTNSIVTKTPLPFSGGTEIYEFPAFIEGAYTIKNPTAYMKLEKMNEIEISKKKNISEILIKREEKPTLYILYDSDKNECTSNLPSSFGIDGEKFKLYTDKNALYINFTIRVEGNNFWQTIKIEKLLNGNLELCLFDFNYSYYTENQLYYESDINFAKHIKIENGDLPSDDYLVFFNRNSYAMEVMLRDKKFVKYHTLVKK